MQTQYNETDKLDFNSYVFVYKNSLKYCGDENDSGPKPVLVNVMMHDMTALSSQDVKEYLQRYIGPKYV